jgi:hypothetical protein
MQNLKDVNLDDLPAETQKEIMAIMERAVSQKKAEPSKYVDLKKINDYLRIAHVHFATDAEVELLAMADTFNKLVIAILEDDHQDRANGHMVALLGYYLRWQKLWEREHHYAPF